MTARDRLARWLRLSTGALVGSVLVGVVVISALAAPLVTWHAPETINARARLASPSATHPLGTDQFGRDVLARVVYGGRVSLQVGLTAVLVAVVLGGGLGLLLALYPRWIDAVAMRVLDVLIAFPSLLLALLLVAVFGSDLNNLILAISLTRAPFFALLVRAEASSIVQQPYVEAARVLGIGQGRLVFGHVLPNVLPLLLVSATTSIAAAILAESALSYLGLGAQPPTPSWGRMLTEARAFYGQAAWLAVAPGLAIMMTVVGFNLLGDGLRDLLDPRVRGR